MVLFAYLYQTRSRYYVLDCGILFPHLFFGIVELHKKMYEY